MSRITFQSCSRNVLTSPDILTAMLLAGFLVGCQQESPGKNSANKPVAPVVEHVPMEETPISNAKIPQLTAVGPTDAGQETPAKVHSQPEPMRLNWDITKARWQPNPNPAVPFAGKIVWAISSPLQQLSMTDMSVVITLTESAEAEPRQLTWALEELIVDAESQEASDIEYAATIFGTCPDTLCNASIELLDMATRNVLAEAKVQWKTPKVSQLFPQITVTHADQARMESGLTLFNLIRWENDVPDTDFGAIVAIDADGQIRWSYEAPHLIFIVKQLETGNLMYGYGNRTDGLIEIDLLGNEVRRWSAANLNRTVPESAIAVPVDSMHHDITILDNETLLLLSTELHEMQNYYAPTYEPRDRVDKAHLIADLIVEMKTDGKIVRKWPLFEILDPRRIGYGSLHHFWNQRGYEHVDGGTFDWSHSNCVTYDPRDNSIIVSVRHQDAVIKIDRLSGELKWILGNPQNWRGEHRKKLLKPINRPKWPYHQHAVEITPQGTLLMFDNGNFQAMPFDKQLSAENNHSRVVEFRVDEQEMTVEQVWEYTGEPGQTYYSTFLCDVDWLPETGNVLITDGGEIRDAQGLRTDAAPGNIQWAEIFEVTYPTPSEQVFSLKVTARPGDENIGWSIYRSQRIRDLFSSTTSN